MLGYQNDANVLNLVIFACYSSTSFSLFNQEVDLILDNVYHFSVYLSNLQFYIEPDLFGNNRASFELCKENTECFYTSTHWPSTNHLVKTTPYTYPFPHPSPVLRDKPATYNTALVPGSIL